MSSFPKLHTGDSAQELYTRPEDTIKIIPYLNPAWTIWEMCYGEGHMAKALEAKGMKVVGDATIDALTDSPAHFDAVATNPPWRNHKEFIERAICHNKPFAFLCRLEHIGGRKAFELFSDLEGFAILIPEKRINYITPRMRNGGVAGTAAFHSIWLTRGLPNIKSPITYIR